MNDIRINTILKRIKFILSLHKSIPLVWKLLWDKRISKGIKTLFLIGIFYLIAPFDFIPDVILPLGLTDDFTILIFLFERFLSSIPVNILEEYLN